MLSPPKPLYQIQPNLVFELLTCMGRATVKKFGTAPLKRDQKVKYHLISITKSVLKIFVPNFVCILTNNRYKHISGIFMPQGWDFGALGVPRCSIIYFFSNMVM